MTKKDYISYVGMKSYSQRGMWFATGILAACIDRFCADTASEEEIDLQANKCAEIIAMCKDATAPSSDQIILAHDIIKRNINVKYVRYKAPDGIGVDKFFQTFFHLYLEQLKAVNNPQ